MGSFLFLSFSMNPRDPFSAKASKDSSFRNNPQLQQFVHLFLEKNKVINLSAIRDEEEVWTKHIEDSLVIIPLLRNYQEQRVTLSTGRQESKEKKLEVLDLGTGG